jgi:hypothetical protein
MAPSSWPHASFPRRFVSLALAIDRHLPGFVDANPGPAEWKQMAEAGPVPGLPQLAAEAAELLDEVTTSDSLEGLRRGVLIAQLRAAAALLRRLSGEPMTFSQEVESLYEHTPQWTDESLFEEHHHHLNDLLPGRGPLAERIASFKQTLSVPPEKLPDVLSRILPRLHSATRGLFPLPPDEAVELRFVTGQPWSAFNAFLGRARSRVEIGIDWPQPLPDLADLVAHEAYPGHHTEQTLREAAWIDARGWDEGRLILLNSPLSVISEGLAMSALSIVMDESEWKSWHRDEIFPAAGLAELDPDVAWGFHVAGRFLSRSLGNAAFLLLDQGAGDEEAISYLRRYRLVDEAAARRSLEFILNPLVRGYVFNYWVGSDLIGPLLQPRSQAPRAFGRLLLFPLTPSQVLDGAAEQVVGS